MLKIIALWVVALAVVGLFNTLLAAWGACFLFCYQVLKVK